MIPEREGKTTEKTQPGSFDSLAAGIGDKFEEIEAEVEKMREELEKADEQSGPLLNRLVDGATGRPEKHG